MAALPVKTVTKYGEQVAVTSEDIFRKRDARENERKHTGKFDGPEPKPRDVHHLSGNPRNWQHCVRFIRILELSGFCE